LIEPARLRAIIGRAEDEPQFDQSSSEKCQCGI
jgi:hypothetical protein